MASKVQIGIQTTFDAAGAAAAKVALGQVGASATKAEKDLLGYAQAAARLQSAQGNAAGAVKTLSSALAQVNQSSKQALSAQQQLEAANNALAKSASGAAGGMAVLPRTIAGLSHEAASAAAGMLTLSTAMAVAKGTVESFAEAFKFKADLDATTLSVNAQLKGVRDSGQVWDQASAFAQKFKLTQQETTQAVAASIGVMRASKAPVEDVLGVLARMQVLSPEQSLEEAAIALKALASGDTTSLVTRFEVGRDVANQMKQEIQGGADAVAVMSKFLGDTGIGMDVLASKTEGAAGKIKELAQAQEQLKLAQAEFAQGPGMVVLEGQIRATSGATRTLSGDFEAMRGSVVTSINEGVAAMSEWNPVANAVAQAIGTVTGASAAQAAQQQQSTAVVETGVTAFGAYQQAAMAAAEGQMQLAAAAAVSAMQSQADAAAKDEQASKTALAAAQADAAAMAFMALHPNISASGVASLAAAGQITPLLSQLIQAKMRADEAANALARFNTMQGLKVAKIAPREAESEIASMKHAGVEADRAARAKVNAAQYAAEKERTLAVGTAAQKQSLLQNEYNAAVKMYGANSTQAYQAQTKILQAQEKGGAARASSAGATADKLTGIEQKTGDKIADIVEGAQKKITAIAEREAAKQAAALQKLNESMKTAEADRRASAEADDLDLIGVTDDKEAAKLNDRERAQAASREREKAAQDEARATAAAGDAELAQKQYDIREKQIGDQEALDEKYYDKQRELAGDPATQEALKQQYDEATRANEEAAQVRIDMAKAEADQKAAAVEAEKASVVAAAEDEANKVIGAAERSAAGIKNASGSAKAQATADLRAIGDAVNAIPSSKTITITVNQQGGTGGGDAAGSSGGGSGNRAAGGGTFMTKGKTTLTVGDNPGGREIVTVTPIGGSGTSRASGNLVAMAGGGVLDAGGGYTTPIAGGGGAAPGGGGGGGRAAAAGGGKATQSLKDAVAEQKALVELLSMLINLRDQLNAQVNAQPFRMGLIQGLAKRAAEFVQIVEAQLVPTTKETAEGFKRYVDVAKGAVDILSGVADLRHQLQENANDQPFDMNLIRGLARRAADFATIVQAKLVPTSEYAADAMSQYASTVGDTVGILKDVADLRSQLSKGSGTAFDMKLIERLAADAVRITEIVKGTVLPATKAEGEALDLYADVVGSSVGIIKDVSGLTADMFTDYHSPSNAEIAMLARDAQRLASGFMDAGKIMGKDAAEAGKAYAEGVGAAFSAAREGLLVIDALNSGDFVLKGGALVKFQGASMQILDVMQALGARASTIPTSDIAALQTVTSAISGQAEALIRLAAVPFGDLAGAAQGLGSSGGAMGVGGTTIYNTFQISGAGDPNAIANIVYQRLNAQMRSHR